MGWGGGAGDGKKKFKGVLVYGISLLSRRL